MHAEVFILMSMVGAVTFILYLLISSRHKERLALLEFDRDATVFHPERRLRTSWALRFGLLLLFGGVGLLFGYLVLLTIFLLLLEHKNLPMLYWVL